MLFVVMCKQSCINTLNHKLATLSVPKVNLQINIEKQKTDFKMLINQLSFSCLQGKPSIAS